MPFEFNYKNRFLKQVLINKKQTGSSSFKYFKLYTNYKGLYEYDSTLKYSFMFKWYLFLEIDSDWESELTRIAHCL